MVVEIVLAIVAIAAMTFVGVTLCRDKKQTTHCVGCGRCVAGSGCVLRKEQEEAERERKAKK